MKYLHLFVFFLVVSFSSFAQSNYKPGYVVNLKNDTLKGFIGYQEWENNPKEFTFKSNLNQSQHQSFSIYDANAFGIIGAEHFQKFIFSKTTASNNLNKISIHLDSSHTTATAFLKVLVKGKNVSLYSFTDNIKTRFYILRDRHNSPEELNYYIYYITEDEIKYQTLYPFRSQLQDLADIYNVKDTKLAEKIKYANYNESDIKNVVELINGGVSLKDFESNNVSGFRIFVGSAARVDKLVLGGGNGFFSDGTSINVTSPVVSAGIDLFLNKNTKKLVFRFGVEFSSIHYIVPPTEINEYNTKASIDFKQTNVSIIPQVTYNAYSNDKFKIFVNGGLGFNFSSYNQYNYLLNFNNVSTIKKPNYPGFARFYNEARVKSGLEIDDKVEIYGLYSFPGQLKSSSVSVSFYQAGVNYLF